MKNPFSKNSQLTTTEISNITWKIVHILMILCAFGLMMTKCSATEYINVSFPFEFHVRGGDEIYMEQQERCPNDADQIKPERDPEVDLDISYPETMNDLVSN